MTYTSRAHFLAVASEAMATDFGGSCRSRNAQKRGGVLKPVSLEGLDPGEPPQILDIIELDELLKRPCGNDPRMARVVQLRYFGGLTTAEIAEILKIHERTVKRDWEFARAWLAVGQLQKGLSMAARTMGPG